MPTGSRMSALDLFVGRLDARSQIGEAERDALLALGGYPQRISAHREFVRQGDTVQDACLVVDGLVARFGQLEDGSRQIISLHIPGDVVDLYALMLSSAPSSLLALTNSTILNVPLDALRGAAMTHQGLATAFWRDCAADAAIVAQWLVNVGRKNARGRIAHLICEMAVRYAQIDELRGCSFPFPITQEQLADALGLTSVHVNRSIKTLRQDGVVQIARAGVTILDWKGLASIGEFDSGYLNLPVPAGALEQACTR